MKRHNLFILMGIVAATAMSACSGEKKESADEGRAAPAAQAPAAAPSAAGAAAPAPGRKVIVINLVTDGAGNRFEPNKIEAEKGDLLRFTLKAGVHNVDFLADSNPGKTGLPKASDMLQLPGQTVDIPVTFDKGRYYFQCDPHAALGMKGHVKVESD